MTVAVSLADKLDTLVAFFANEMPPTGSKDPYALRRAALGSISTIFAAGIDVELLKVIFLQALAQRLQRTHSKAYFDEALKLAGYRDLSGAEWPDRGTLETYKTDAIAIAAKTNNVLLDFFADRLKVQQREAGVRHDLIDAVFALGGEDDLVRLLARVKALQAFVETEDGANLLAGYRRAANILRAEAKKDGVEPGDRHPGPVPGSTGDPAPSLDPEWMPEQVRHDGEGGAFVFAYTPEPAERALADALDAQLPLANQAIADERFEDAMTALAIIRPAIDRFFDDVTVNSPDGTQRATRLALLDKFRAAMHNIADFSRIEG